MLDKNETQIGFISQFAQNSESNTCSENKKDRRRSKKSKAVAHLNAYWTTVSLTKYSSSNYLPVVAIQLPEWNSRNASGSSLTTYANNATIVAFVLIRNICHRTATWCLIIPVKSSSISDMIAFWPSCLQNQICCTERQKGPPEFPKRSGPIESKTISLMTRTMTRWKRSSQPASWLHLSPIPAPIARSAKCITSTKIVRVHFGTLLMGQNVYKLLLCKMHKCVNTAHFRFWKWN